MKIGFDIMGGDFAPENAIKGALLAQKELSKEDTIVLIGDEEKAKSLISEYHGDAALFEYVHTTEVIGMGEHAAKAFTQKQNSSIAIGFKLLREESIHVFASAGNTGSMLVGSMFTIKAIPGVIRPCITSILPKENGGMGLILDVGSNADCKPDVLYQFGVLGAIYAERVYNIKNPKVALLNIGEESEKGNLVAQAAHNLMKDSKDFNFIGNVEGRDLFNDAADVIVCEGFVGNVVLKEAEAFYFLLKKRGLLDEYFHRFNYENYGGTAILGANGNVIIGHGISNDIAFKNMLLHSKDVVKANLPHYIRQKFN
jgi:phosphate acyltransferase